MVADEIKDGEVASGVALDPGIVAQLEQADVTMMILQRLELKLRAILGLQFKALVAAVVSRQVLVEPVSVVIEE